MSLKKNKGSQKYFILIIPILLVIILIIGGYFFYQKYLEAEDKIINMVPAETLLYIHLNLNRANPRVNEFLNYFQQNEDKIKETREEIYQEIDNYLKLVNSNLEEDILKNIDQEASLFLVEDRGKLEGVVAVEIRDPSAFEKEILTKLQGIPLDVQSQDYQNVKITKINLSLIKTFGDILGDSIDYLPSEFSYAFLNNYFIISQQDNLVRKVIDLSQDSQSILGSSGSLKRKISKIQIFLENIFDYPLYIYLDSQELATRFKDHNNLTVEILVNQVLENKVGKGYYKLSYNNGRLIGDFKAPARLKKSSAFDPQISRGLIQLIPPDYSLAISGINFSDTLGDLIRGDKGGLLDSKDYLEKLEEFYHLDLMDDILPLLTNRGEIILQEEKIALVFTDLDAQKAQERLSNLEDTLVKYLAYTYPQAKEKVLPDNTTSIELLPNPEIYQPEIIDFEGISLDRFRIEGKFEFLGTVLENKTIFTNSQDLMESIVVTYQNLTKVNLNEEIQACNFDFKNLLGFLNLKSAYLSQKFFQKDNLISFNQVIFTEEGDQNHLRIKFCPQF